MITATLSHPRLLEGTFTLPATPVVTPGDVGQHLRRTLAVEDQWLQRAIKAATEMAQEACRRCFITQAVTAQWSVKEASYLVPVRLPYSPFVELTTISTFEEGTETTETVGNFHVTGGQVAPMLEIKDAGTWDAVAGTAEVLEVVYQAGYGATAMSVPPGIQQAIIVAVADWHLDRTTAFRELPEACHSLLTPYKVLTI